uniref:Uncharacterized protein n=1 Tax=Candidatus Kentrum sp. SD TaxID=2126332 RepID=A0A450YM19_9GAMM|nr:MAG: hypothetical protein BECKSD772F_GA0070984_101924 [Candidatus Kentron sp. SD]VFK42591.1 MAG: hypothetical protein BECKSD772E_GA0070983_101825 [Candidatus Kentron sp. SD]
MGVGPPLGETFEGRRIFLDNGRFGRAIQANPTFLARNLPPYGQLSGMVDPFSRLSNARVTANFGPETAGYKGVASMRFHIRRDNRNSSFLNLDIAQ